MAKPKQLANKATFIESMECLPVTKLPEGPQWSYEIKLYRLAAGVWTSTSAEENKVFRSVASMSMDNAFLTTFRRLSVHGFAYPQRDR
jgi:hypothetical protein